MVTNGGYGGVHYAMACGVALVVAGKTEDNVEVTARIAWSGAGLDLRTNCPQPDRIRAAVRSVLADSRYREANAVCDEQIAATPGVVGLEQLITDIAKANPAA